MWKEFHTPTVYNYPRRDFRTYPNYFPVMKRMWAMPLILQSSVALLNDIALEKKLSQVQLILREDRLFCSC